MDLEAALWSELPFEIMEQVLSFVPVPDLCRYRTVCKAWNHLISDLRFAAVHAQNASKRPDKMSFIVTWNESWGQFACFWSALDLDAKRWYKLNSGWYGFGLLTTGMGGGLVCEYLEDPSRKVKSITVSNPIANKGRVLPTAPIDRQSGGLCLAIDTNTVDNFKVILFPRKVYMEQQFVMHVYDSATNEWKGMKNPTWFPTKTGSIVKHIIFQGSVYVLFQNELWRINLMEDVWERLYVPGGSFISEHLELIVSANRLFLGRIEDRAKTLVYIETEIKVSESTKQMVLDHSKAKHIELLGADPKFWQTVNMFRFGSSLIFMSARSGEMKSFDVVRGTWDMGHEWRPLNKSLQQLRALNTLRGEHMNLLLPNRMIW
ncbi:hypothetical protein KC19_8G027000 [Ceratodon purpureus]|uniref:F-box domain-containing protein n=1 Tax=Ceratodon purpureus TaxID=3225 RepID=A0A8T0GXV3_CERPU|nr:hypothetical protein KC19_8G027000 [Ceratodon purpureus]